MEAVAAFGASPEGLHEFARWARGWRGDCEGEGEAGREGAGVEGEGGSAVGTGAAAAAAAAAAEAHIIRLREYKRKHKTVRRNWVLPEHFPSQAVTEAYLRPVVDHSEAPCTWSQPDLHGLRAFCYDKFG